MQVVVVPHIQFELSEADVARIADAVADRLRPRKGNVSVAAAAREIGVSGRSVYRLIATGRLLTTKVGTRTLVLRESIDRITMGAS